MLPTSKGNIWFMPISKTVLETFLNEMMKADVGFKISEADPCLYRETKLGICMIIIYVDDMMVIGHKESKINVQERVERVFSSKTENNLADYLGCEFHMNRDKTKGWLGQPSIIRSLEKNLVRKP